MPSIIQYSVVLFVGLLVPVSSFSNVAPSSRSNQQFRNGCPSPTLVSQPNEQRRHNGIAYQQPTCESPLVLRMSSEATAVVDSQEARNLFSKYSDENSLMDRKTLESMAFFANMLADGDLEPEELDEIWEAATKSSDDSSCVDVDSFVKIFNDVDDLFEDDDDDDSSDEAEAPTGSTDNNDLDEELSKAFQSISDDNGLISKDAMKKWEEIESLFEDGLLGEDEFEELWNDAVDGEKGSLNVSGFSKFNAGLDDLFVLEDDDDDDDEEDIETEDDKPEASSTTIASPRAMVVEGDMPPGVLFSQLADKNNLVGMKELNLWTELKELLDDEDLLQSELQEMYDKFVTPENAGNLNEDGFLQLYDEIDNLFEEVDEEEDDAQEVVSAPPPQQQSPQMNTRVKDDLLAFIDIIVEDDEEELLCGFGASEADQAQVLNIVKVLEQQPSNIIVQKDGNIERLDLAGNWELVFTSSSAMKFNQGLTGIGGSFPNGKFGGVRQELTATKFLSDFEYKERIEVNPSSASFDVTVDGIWDLQKSISLFTGQPTVILNVEPGRVKYGLTSTRGDHWKSLGPVNRLDLSYLDDDLRVMRGCTSSETIFVFKKI